MEVILLERVEKLGQMGDVVKVRPGFARNYLLPQKKALRANQENRAYFEAQRAQLEARNLELRKEAESVGEKLEGQTVSVIRQASENDVLYGSVSTRDIAEAFTKAGFSIHRNQIVLDRPLKELGIHHLRVRLHPEVSAQVRVAIAKSEEESAALLDSAEDARAAEQNQELVDEEVMKEIQQTMVSEETGPDGAQSDVAPDKGAPAEETRQADEG